MMNTEKKWWDALIGIGLIGGALVLMWGFFSLLLWWPPLSLAMIVIVAGAFIGGVAGPDIRQWVRLKRLKWRKW
jgi:hypothetical protein